MGVYIYRNSVSKERYAALEKWRFELTKGKEEWLLIHFNNLHILFTALSILLSAYHLYTNNWIASNFIALSFSFNAISFLRLDSFMTGMILLSGLFFYDIYWVFYSSKTFGQSVMVSIRALQPRFYSRSDLSPPCLQVAVATNFEAYALQCFTSCCMVS
jgi:minor histocompatibility antigen H13